MNKYKIDIQKKELSWEKKFSKKCDIKNCKEKGKFKAPKSRIRLNEYYFFCLKHIKEYNKSWDFYKGLTVNQIEESMRDDTVWDRPSWPLKGSQHNIMEQLNQFMSNNYKDFDDKVINNSFFNNKLINETFSTEHNKALKVLGLYLPLTIGKIKKKYKKLVKIFHPDVNDSDKEAEEKFKEINKAYRVLLRIFVKE